jgi:dTDP-4-amino-4,6-dideoxygalactose transaminase
MIKLTAPFVDEQDLAAVREALESGSLVQGPRVAAFEAALAAYVGRDHAVAMNSCTSALHLSLLALGTGPGDLVVLPAYSFTATANAVELCGGRPVFVDIDPQTFNLDPRALRITLDRLQSDGTRDRVRAVLPVHTFGQMSDMVAIQAIADRCGIPVVEDAACALGATEGGRQAGTFGTMACFSFHPRKTLTTGEGGAVVTNDTALARTLRTLRNHGLDPDAGCADFVRPGFNNRMTEFQAALGSVQLKRMDAAIDARRQAAERYGTLLKGSIVEPQVVAEGRHSVYQSYVVLLPEAAAAARDAVIRRMRELDVEATIGTWNIPMTTYYRKTYGYKPEDFPTSAATFARSITLPMYYGLSASEQRQVVAALSEAIDDVGITR